MPLDPDRLQDLSERMVNLSKRFDAFIEERKADPEDEDEDDDDEDEDEDDDEDDEDLREPAEAALRNSPGSELPNPDLDEPWYGHNQ